MTLTLVLDLHIENINHAYIFWKVCSRILMFVVTNPFIGYQQDWHLHWVPTRLTLWPWPFCLTYLLKTLTLAVSCEWYVLGLLIFHRSVLWDKIPPWVPTGLTLTLTIDLHIENFNFCYNFQIVCTRTWIYHDCSLWQGLSMANDVTTIIEQVIWQCELSIWPIFQKLWCRYGCQWNLSLSGAFVFHKHILFYLCCRVLLQKHSVLLNVHITMLEAVYI
jgi:hypothetical protein